MDRPTALAVGGAAWLEGMAKHPEPCGLFEPLDPEGAPARAAARDALLEARLAEHGYTMAEYEAACAKFDAEFYAKSKR